MNDDEGSEAAPSPDDFDSRRREGRERRRRVPRSSHSMWIPGEARPDPVTVLEDQAATRVAELVPIRYGRMSVSPFTFYRGAAAIMAADLATTPSSGLTVQLCGDAHLSNFGLFGTPERRLVFDINDFDETLPGPFEWDVKRLAASFEIASRSRGFSDDDRRKINETVVRSYRRQMARAAGERVLDAWYDRLDVEDVLAVIEAERKEHHAGLRQQKVAESTIAKARTRDSMRAFEKLVGTVDGRLRIRADPPLIVPIEDLVQEGGALEDDVSEMRSLLAEYQSTLQTGSHPLKEFAYLHMARKVVGVGSVGTRAWIVLLRGRDDTDPLLLQAKEAQTSVLEAHVGASSYDNHGERVVRGQRMMQASSDIFLGWQRVTGVDGATRDFYLRQLYDWKGSVDVDSLRVPGAMIYARLCGETLARAHSRSGDRVSIAAYLGGTDRFDRAVADFAEYYADQNDDDYRAFMNAIDDGRIGAVSGL